MNEADYHRDVERLASRLHIRFHRCRPTRLCSLSFIKMHKGRLATYNASKADGLLT